MQDCRCDPGEPRSTWSLKKYRGSKEKIPATWSRSGGGDLLLDFAVVIVYDNDVHCLWLSQIPLQ